LFFSLQLPLHPYISLMCLPFSAFFRVDSFMV
jgi:hypothetical protein